MNHTRKYYRGSDTNRRGGLRDRERSGLSLCRGESELEYLKNTARHVKISPQHTLHSRHTQCETK
jgi:hypothetical protein